MWIRLWAAILAGQALAAGTALGQSAAPQPASPAPGQPEPQKVAPPRDQATERAPRPPWTSPPVVDPSRPDAYQRFLLERRRYIALDRFGRPSYLQHVNGYPYAAGWQGSIYPQADLYSAYEQGRADEREYIYADFNINDMNTRKERVLGAAQRATDAGLSQLQSGNNAGAAMALAMAADLDQGDPAARVHLAQAQLVLGNAAEAGKSLRRALQLQPKLVYTDLQLDRSFGRGGMLAEQADRLDASLSGGRPAIAEEWYLLAFLRMQQGRFDRAAVALREAGARSELLREDDAFVAMDKLLRSVAPAAGAAPAPAQSPVSGGERRAR